MRASILLPQSIAAAAAPAAVGGGEPGEGRTGEVLDGALGADIRRARVGGRPEEPRAGSLPLAEREGEEESGGRSGRNVTL